MDKNDNVYYSDISEQYVYVVSPNGTVMKKFEAVDFILCEDVILLSLKDGSMTLIENDEV